MNIDKSLYDIPDYMKFFMNAVSDVVLKKTPGLVFHIEDHPGQDPDEVRNAFGAAFFFFQETANTLESYGKLVSPRFEKIASEHLRQLVYGDAYAFEHKIITVKLSWQEDDGPLLLTFDVYESATADSKTATHIASTELKVSVIKTNLDSLRNS